MAWALNDIANLARIWLHDSGKSMLSDDDLIILANRGSLEIAKEIGYPIQYQHKIDLPVGTGTAVASLSMPDNFVRFIDKDYATAVSISIDAGTTWTAIPQKERAELGATIDIDTTTSVPTAWFPFGANATYFRQIGITPKWAGAVQTNGVSLNYVYQPTAYTILTYAAPGDVAVNELTEHFPIATALFIVAEAWGKYSTVNKNTYLALFRTYLAYAKRQEKNRFRFEAEAIPIMNKAV